VPQCQVCPTHPPEAARRDLAERAAPEPVVDDVFEQAPMARERFDRQKLVQGLLKACEKRPVSVAAVEAIADRVEATLQDRPEKEIATADIGSFVMEELRKLDKVAYVRFASVYKHFRDISEFVDELKQIAERKE